MASALRMGPPTLRSMRPSRPPGRQRTQGPQLRSRLLYSIRPRVCEAPVPNPSWDHHCDKRSSEQPPTWEPPESADTGRWHRASPTPHLPASAQCLGRPSHSSQQTPGWASPHFPQGEALSLPSPHVLPHHETLVPWPFQAFFWSTAWPRTWPHSQGHMGNQV